MRFKAGKCFSVILLLGILTSGLACTKAPDDSQLTSQIQSKLGQDSGLHDKQITVQTAGGVATLSGTVENETQREAAARYASATPGIKEVVNNLETASATTTRPADQMAQPPPSPARRSAVPFSDRRHPSTPHHRHQTQRDSSQMAAADGPPPPEARNVAADENPAPAPAAQAAPAPQPPPPPPPRRVTVPSGTSMAIRLLDLIDSEKAQPGQTFRATLDAPLPSDGDVAVPSGYDVKGHIVDVKSAGKFAGQSLLVLELDSISVSGKLYGIEADPYRRQGSNRTTNTAKKVGAGAVIGAIIGGIAGGGKGAGIGAAAGGGVGGGVQAAGKGQQIILPSETVLSFTLRSPLTVTLTDRGPDSGRHKLDAPQ
ncbi:MAG TPA: BON domain-containing protein [Candidatus Acidoferrum sp.]